jgi:hypothetical protein
MSDCFVVDVNSGEILMSFSDEYTAWLWVECRYPDAIGLNVDGQPMILVVR